MKKQLRTQMAESFVTESKEDCLPDMNEKKLIGTLRTIRMTVAETEQMYAAFSLPIAKPSPLLTALRFLLRPTAVITSVLIASVTVGTISYAAEFALPGDTLYPIKIHINEAIQEKLMFSSDARALYGADRAKKRLEEAEALEAKGRLSAETRVALLQTFQKRLRQSQEDVRVLKTSNPKAAAALETRVDLTLKGHAPMLELLEKSASELKERKEKEQPSVKEKTPGAPKKEHEGRGEKTIPQENILPAGAAIRQTSTTGMLMMQRREVEGRNGVEKTPQQSDENKQEPDLAPSNAPIDASFESQIKAPILGNQDKQKK